MKILVSAAKTGGHIFPAIAVGHEISKLGHDVIFMGSGEPIEVNALKTTKFKYFVSSMQGFRGKNIFAKIKSLILIPISVFTTIRIIRNEKDKRSIFILPSVITIKTFEGFIDRRDIMYKVI